MAPTFWALVLGLLTEQITAQYPLNGDFNNLTVGSQWEDEICLNNICTQMSGRCLAKNEQCLPQSKLLSLYGLSKGGDGCTCNCCVTPTSSSAEGRAEEYTKLNGGNSSSLLQVPGLSPQPRYAGIGCMATIECVMAHGVCVADESLCDSSVTYATNQCLGTFNCACCISKQMEICYPINKNACSSPGSYCQDLNTDCGNDYKEVYNTCTKMSYIGISGMIIPIYCKCCVKKRGKKSGKDCPNCGIANLEEKGYNNVYGQRIAGGEEIKPPHKYPWLVLLRSHFGELQGYCGGSIINSQYVLTASHCLYDGVPYGCNFVDSTDVIVGLHKVDRSDEIKGVTRIVGVDKYIKYPLYSCEGIQDNDIALLKLDETLDFFNKEQLKWIGPVCLPVDDSKTYDGYKGTVAGWGATATTRMIAEFNPKSDETPQPFPSEVTVPIRDDFCKVYPAHWMTGNMMCAGDKEEGKDSCKGDSGGPLVVLDEGKYVLVGTVAFGPEGGNCNGPGVYTRVTNYLDWIDMNTKDIGCHMMNSNRDKD